VPARGRMPVRVHRGTPGAQLRAARGGDRAALFTAASLRRDQYRQRAADYHRGLPLGRPAMSVAGGTTPAVRAPSWPRWAGANIALALALPVRAPRAAAKPRWPSYPRVGAGVVATPVVLAGLMGFVVGWGIQPPLVLSRWVR